MDNAGASGLGKLHFALLCKKLNIAAVYNLQNACKRKFQLRIFEIKVVHHRPLVVQSFFTVTPMML